MLRLKLIRVGVFIGIHDSGNCVVMLQGKRKDSGGVQWPKKSTGATVKFWSGKLSGAEQNYCFHDGELLTAVEVFK
jgi:hypothetical protein